MSRPAQTEYNQKTNAHGFRKEDYLSVSQAAEFLKVSPSTLRKLVREGKAIAEKQENGYKLFRIAYLEKLKEKLDEEHEHRKHIQYAHYIKPKSEIKAVEVKVE